jgi:hypothetical protein
MGDYGRIQALVIATMKGHVVYERFYSTFTDLERAEMRAALQTAADPILPAAQDGLDYVARYRAGAVVFMKVQDLVFYMIGSGEYDELMLREALGAVAGCLAEALGRTPNEAAMFRDYGRAVLALDEVICEGILDNTDPRAVRRNVAD